MKFGLDIGHNCKPVDIGAIGLRKEDELNKIVGLKVMEKLNALKHEVVLCTPSYASNLGDSLYRRTNKANEEKVDLYVSIHFNAGGGHGTEVFAISKESKEIAKRVVDSIAALGYVNRGVKDGSWLYVLKNTKMPAILVEGGFVDSKEDMEKFNADDIANAIVKGVTENVVFEDKIENIDVKTSKNIVLSKIQNGLNILCIFNSTGKRLALDGIMGEKTVSVIKQFQSITGLPVTGDVDVKTNEALVNILSKPVLKFGTKNIVAIRYIQWRLNIVVDGIFGNDTEKAVLRFQIIKRITADGILGIVSWTELLE